MEPNDQQQSFDTGPTTKPRTQRQREIDDFRKALPPGILPTTLRVMEHNGHILAARHYAFNEKPTRAQERLFHALVALGKSPDAPGSVAALAIWGIPGVVARQIKRYDWVGDSKIELATDDSILAAISGWWHNETEGR